MQNGVPFKPDEVSKMEVEDLLLTYEILVEQQNEKMKALENG
jgi:hypothetical protein